MKRISAEKEITAYISNVIEKNIEYYATIKDKVFLSEKIIYLVEVKGDDKLNDPDVLVEKQKSIEYCKLVSKWAEETENKKWIHVFIPASKISSMSTFKYLSEYYAVE